MFSITDGKGFQIKFENGVTVSVQFGACNYCEHYSSMDFEAPKKAKNWESKTAEIALIGDDGVWYDPSDFTAIAEGNDVKGYVEADEVANVIYNASQIVTNKKGG